MPTCPGESGSSSNTLPSPVTLTLDTVAADPEEKARARKAARDFRSLRVPGKEVEARVNSLLKLRWHRSLGWAARVAKTDNKPILWIQALGDVKGFL